MPRNRNRSGQSVVTPAAEYAITLTEAKNQLRITHSDEDDALNMFIAAACDYTEGYLGRTLIEQTWDLFWDCFPCGDNAIKIPAPPLISVTSIKYFDNSDVEQTWDAANYTVDVDQAYEALIYPAINASYPSTRQYPKSVTIRVVAGYENSGASPVVLADNVPTQIKQAILLLIGHMWENREASAIAVKVETIPMGYAAMLSSFRLREF